MSSRFGYRFVVSLVVAGACASTSAFAGGLLAGGDGFRPVSEEFHGGAPRASDEVAMRSNSIRTDVNRYNAERSTPRSPSSGGNAGHGNPPRGGYRTN
jgi:hypothetical protein